MAQSWQGRNYKPDKKRKKKNTGVESECYIIASPRAINNHRRWTLKPPVVSILREIAEKRSAVLKDPRFAHDEVE